MDQTWAVRVLGNNSIAPPSFGSRNGMIITQNTNPHPGAQFCIPQRDDQSLYPQACTVPPIFGSRKWDDRTPECKPPPGARYYIPTRSVQGTNTRPPCFRAIRHVCIFVSPNGMIGGYPLPRPGSGTLTGFMRGGTNLQISCSYLFCRSTQKSEAAHRTISGNFSLLPQ